MRKVFIGFIILLIGAATAVWPARHTRAQSVAEAVVVDTETIPAQDSLLADVYFTLQDEGGRPYPTAEIESATVLLEDGRRFPAQISKPPYYVALVIDASGSMRAALPAVQSAAASLVDAAPPETYFAVIRFDESISLVQPFTNDQAQVLNAINNITITDSGTCLYDVAYTALQSLEDVSGTTPRRAMVIFSDGRDEVRQGAGDTCSSYTYDQLLAFATQRSVPVPVHTVGIAAPNQRVDASALSKLAADTGGVAVNGSDAELTGLINTLTADIRSQWLAHAALKPAPGLQRAALLLQLADGQMPLGGSFALSAGQDYRERRGIPAVDIGNFRYDPEADLFRFDVALSNLPDVGSLQVETLDQQTNVQVDLAIEQSPSSVQSILLPTGDLEPGQQYVVKVTPRRQTGEVVRTDSGAPLTAVYPFGYDPPRPLQLKISGVQIRDEPARFILRTLRLEDDNPTLQVALELTNAETLAGLNGRLIDRTTQQVADSFLLDVDGTGTAVVPLQVPGGDYRLVVEAVDENGTALASTSYDFAYTAPDNQVVQTGRTVRTNPLLWMLLIGLLAFGLAGGWCGGLSVGRRQGRQVLVPGLNMSSLAQSSAEVVDDGLPEPVILTLINSPDTAVSSVGQWEITRFPFTIGRENADLTIASDRHVSRQHARLSYEGGDYFIEDLGSSNGTHVNETKIAAHEPIPLRTDRDSRIQIGRTTIFSFHVAAPETAPAAAGATAGARNGSAAT